MARCARVEIEGAVYHVVSGGAGGAAVFSSERDRNHLLAVLRRGVEKHGVKLHAYCVMADHYHLLLSAPAGALSRFMHYVGSSYGSHLSRAGRVGRVFAGRYRSLCAGTGRCLMELSRLVHLVPVQAGIVRHPDHYPWSSYRFYSGRLECPGWISRDWLLDRWGGVPPSPADRYVSLVEQTPLTPPGRPMGTEASGPAIPGGREFVSRAVRMVSGEERPGPDVVELEALGRRVCAYYGVPSLGRSPDGSGPRVRRGRAMFVFLARRCTGAANRAIASSLGCRSPSSAAHHYRRAARRAEGDDEAATRWNREVREILATYEL